jgi:hypothetical protein
LENRFFLEARWVGRQGERCRRHGGEMAQTIYTHMNKCISNFLKIKELQM